LETLIQSEARLLVTIEQNPYIPHSPFAKQRAFLALPDLEAFYGGAARGGKSDALLMAALQYVQCPGYSAILLRRTFADLKLPEALIPRSHEWLEPTDAHWVADTKCWRFPSGASLTFGYLETETDKWRYRGADFHFVGFDELTDFLEPQFAFLFSRLTKKAGDTVPLRMRSAGNPGGAGHEWVKSRYITPETAVGPFVPARLIDNPAIDQAAYRRSLAKLDPVTRQQLEEGDWDVQAQGNMFKRHWFELVNDYPAQGRRCRYWDFAASKAKRGHDPDWTAGALLTVRDGITYIADMQRLQGTPQEVEQLVKATAVEDGKGTEIALEREPGASGKQVIDHYIRRVLLGYTVRGIPSTEAKPIRAKPLSSAAQAGNVKLVRGAWNRAFLDEACLFPGGAHDDQVDAASGAFAQLTGRTPVRISRLW